MDELSARKETCKNMSSDTTLIGNQCPFLLLDVNGKVSELYRPFACSHCGIRYYRGIERERHEQTCNRQAFKACKSPILEQFDPLTGQSLVS